MSATRIKVCGLTRPEDVAAAVAAGADAVGVVLAPSKRRVTLEQAARVLAGVPASVDRVGVFVDAPPGTVRQAVRALSLTSVQLHGRETPAACAVMGVPVTKALRVGPAFDPAEAEPYLGCVSALLLDTYVPGQPGGTGTTFDWRSIAGRLPTFVPVTVAGGLHPGNVGEAVRMLRPAWVDVSSGVEASPGIKDHRSIQRFVAAVRAADSEVCDV